MGRAKNRQNSPTGSRQKQSWTLYQKTSTDRTPDDYLPTQCLNNLRAQKVISTDDRQVIASFSLFFACIATEFHKKFSCGIMFVYEPLFNLKRWKWIYDSLHWSSQWTLTRGKILEQKRLMNEKGNRRNESITTISGAKLLSVVRWRSYWYESCSQGACSVHCRSEAR